MTAPPRTALAIVSFLPDTGHVIPLLRIGLAMQRAGARVACFLPRSCDGLRSQFPLDLRGDGPRTSPEASALASSFAHSRVSWLTTPYVLRRYFAALRYEASRSLGAIRAALSAFAPDLILADPHGFLTWYRHLAQACAADLVLHDSEGTLRRWQPTTVQARGLPPRDPLRAGLGALSARLALGAEEAVGRALVRLAPPGWPEHPMTLEHVARALGLAPGSPGRDEALRPFHAWFVTAPDAAPAPAPGAEASPYREHAITTGVGALEAREARAGLVVPRDVALFGPLPGAAPALPEDLARWIAGGEGRVVYISFGTMLRVGRELAVAMFDALAALRLRGLWSLAAARAAALGDLPVPPHVRIEPHVPQAAVLRRPEVACCVTHAGAGTIQESLWAGKPMLCVPALWDQPYNASWVAHRGAGLCLSPRRALAGALAPSLAALVHRPSFGAAARRLQAEIEDARGADLVVEHLQRAAAARRVTARAAWRR